MSSTRVRSSRYVTVLMIACACALVSFWVTRRVVNAQGDPGSRLVLYVDGTKHVVETGILRDLRFTKLPEHTDFRFQLEKPSNFKLIAFVSAADCSGCLDELSAWNYLLASNEDRLTGYLIFVDSSPSEIRKAAKFYNQHFTVLWDEENRARGAMSIPDTPIVLLENGQMQLRYAQGPTNDAKANKQFVAAVEQILNQSAPRPQ
jgi:hypothetical protein